MVAVVPNLFYAVWSPLMVSARSPESSAAADWATRLYPQLDTIVRGLGAAGVVLLLMGRSGEPWARFGLVRFSWLLDVWAGMAIWLAALILHGAYSALWIWLAGSAAIAATEQYVQAAFPPPQGMPEQLLLAVASVVNGVSEEPVMRGYLFPRFERLLGSAAVSLAITSVLFASYHVYQGPFGTLSALVGGLLYGGLFWWRRRLWPLAVAHLLADLSAFA